MAMPSRPSPPAAQFPKSSPLPPIRRHGSASPRQRAFAQGDAWTEASEQVRWGLVSSSKKPPKLPGNQRRPESAQVAPPAKTLFGKSAQNGIPRAQSLPPLATCAAKQADKSAVDSNSYVGAKTVGAGTAASAPRGARQSVASTSKGIAAELEFWKRRRGLPPETRVFSITGAFPAIRKALLARGWVENEDKASMLWDFKYALWQKHLGEMSDLLDSQVTNYFARNSEVTSKVGLCTNLQNSFNLDRVDINTFYPRCYDMSNEGQVEMFTEDFKLTSAACLLKRFVDTEGAAPFPEEAVGAALGICRKRCQEVDDTLDSPQQPQVHPEEWATLGMCSLKTPGKRLKPWTGGFSRKSRENHQAQAEITPIDSSTPAVSSTAAAEEACAHFDDGEDQEEPDNADVTGFASVAQMAEARNLLDRIRSEHAQLNMDGYQNIWMLKPAGKSRGRGIQLSARLENILDIGIGRGAEARWIVQKYIENPLVINSKKFDIRQWVVVTRWNPLSVWFYKDCYVRFSFADYDPSKLKNRFAHLTNNSVSKHADDFEEKCDDTMWNSDEFAAYLQRLNIVRSGKKIDDPWNEIVHPAMKRAVYRSLESAQDNVHPRANSFELFGYDFMVSDDMSLWLIEINSSPDLSYSTSTTRTMVKDVLEDLVRVVIDVEKFGCGSTRPRRKWNTARLNVGRFELLEPARRRREEKFPRIKKDAMQLAIKGTGFNLRRPRKRECPDGPDAVGDPKYSATSLLAQQEEQPGACENVSGEDEDSASGDCDEFSDEIP